MEDINTDIRNSDYRVEKLDENRLNDLVILHKAVYGIVQSGDYWKRKYETSYTGVKYIGYLAYNNENIPVAFYGVIPCFFQWGSAIVLVAQSADTMTHPGYRLKGMFVKLATLTYDLCNENGISLVFGFPNQNSHHGLIHKLGWKFTENMERFTIPVTTFPLESVCRRFAWTKRIYKKYTAWILNNYNLWQKGLPNSCLQEGFAGVNRDERYLQYKNYTDTFVIQAGNARAWVKVQHGLVIGDLHATSYNPAMVQKLKAIARKLGVSRILFQCSPGTKLHKYFAASYASDLSFPVVFKDIGTRIPLEQIKFTFADIDIF